MGKNTKTDLDHAYHSCGRETMERIEDELGEEEYLLPLSKMFKGLGDPTRLKIIYVLSHSDLCVCDIASLLKVSQSSISHQLRVLRDLHLVKFERQGKLAIYSLDDSHVLELFEQGLDHVKHK